MLNELHQEGETNLEVLKDQDWSLKAVRVKYITLKSVKSVLFTKLEFSTSQRQTKTTYKMDSGVVGKLIPVKIFKSILSKATTESLCATEKNSVILRMYNNSNVEQYSVSSVWLKHNKMSLDAEFL